MCTINFVATTRIPVALTQKKSVTQLARYRESEEVPRHAVRVLVGAECAERDCDDSAHSETVARFNCETTR